VNQAIGILDQTIAALPPEVAAAASGTAPGAAGPATPATGGPGAAAPGASVGTAASGPAAVVPVAAVAAAPGTAVLGAGGPAAAPGTSAPAPTGSGAPRVGPGHVDPRWATFATQLKTAREALVQLRLSRDSLQRDLAQLAAAARRGNELPKEIARDLAEQHAVLGALYAELATDAAKAGDKNRARRLLATAAHLDPGNRARYESQLQSFDPSGRLSPDTPDSTGSAGQGAPR
jgi:hypothetical protein